MATEQDSFKIYLDPGLAAEVRLLAQSEGRTITGLIRLLLRQYLAEQKEKAAA